MNIIDVILGILALGAIIIIHEFGHFIVAKLNGVLVEEFAIGMGPKIIGIQGKETLYSLRLFPIGGFCKMLGEDTKVDDERSYSNKAPLNKISIVAAGPLMNFIFAVILFIIVSTRGFALPSVEKVEANTPAAAAGLQKGDIFKEINNSKIYTWEDFAISVSTSNKINAKIERNNKLYSIDLKPMWDSSQKRYIVGIYPQYIAKPNLIQCVNYGFRETSFYLKETFVFFKSLFKGKIGLSDFGGPVSIIKVSSKAAESGIWTLMAFAGFLSVQLGIFNIIPFPALDGGWILLFLIEIITRKKLDDNKVGTLNFIGFSLLMVLMVLVIIKDFVYPINI